MRHRNFKVALRLTEAVFLITTLVGCVTSGSSVVLTEDSSPITRYFDEELGSNIEVSLDGSQIVETFTMNYYYVDIGKRWKVIEGRQLAPDAPRPFGAWLPDSYGPFGWDGNTALVNYNAIFAEWSRNETDLIYCVTTCSINIKLRELGLTKSSVRIVYTNNGGKADSFAKDMRRALQYYFFNKPDGTPYSAEVNHEK